MSMLGLFFVLYFIELSVGNSLRKSSLSYIRILQHNSIARAVHRLVGNGGGVNGELFLPSYFKASYFGKLFLCKLDYL